MPFSMCTLDIDALNNVYTIEKIIQLIFSCNAQIMTNKYCIGGLKQNFYLENYQSSIIDARHPFSHGKELSELPTATILAPILRFIFKLILF